MIELFWTDQHIPMNDKAAHELVLSVAESIQPDRIWLGGDWCDFEPVSRWPGKPARVLQLQKEINKQVEELTRLREICPNAEIWFKEGNHEDRLTRYLDSGAKELSSLDCLKLTSLLSLAELDIRFVSNLDRTKFGKLWHLHGNEIRASGINISSTVFRKLGVNCIFGHFHRTQTHFQRFYDRDTRAAWAIGTTGHLEPTYSTHNDWSQSIAIVEYVSSGNFQVDIVSINKTKKRAANALWRGKQFSIQL